MLPPRAPPPPPHCSLPRRAPPRPQPGSPHGLGPECGRRGRGGRGEAAGPAACALAGRGGGSRTRTEGAGREGWSAEGEARGRDDRTPLVAPAGTQRFTRRGGDSQPPPPPGEPSPRACCRASPGPGARGARGEGPGPAGTEGSAGGEEDCGARRRRLPSLGAASRRAGEARRGPLGEGR